MDPFIGRPESVRESTPVARVTLVDDRGLFAAAGFVAAHTEEAFELVEEIVVDGHHTVQRRILGAT